ncbi:sigma-70 family RNA polymerase sigma factor [soil metagenome]
MRPDEIDTQELLDRAAGADPDALNRLLARHREALRRMIALRLDPALGRRVDASDIVQGVLLEASRRLPDYLRDAAMPFPLWLRRIARDHLIDAHRRHRQAQRRSLDRERPLAAVAFPDRSSLDLAEELCDGQPTPAAAAIREELHRRFQAAIGDLGEDDREVLLLRHTEQLSNSEVAHALGLSEAAAGMRYLRALRRLRCLLGQTPSGETLS